MTSEGRALAGQAPRNGSGPDNYGGIMGESGPGVASDASSDSRESAEFPNSGSAPSRNLVEINNATMRYETGKGSVLALAEVNLAFDEGSFVCLVGPSGCGKTTLLQLVGGFVKPSSGEILVDGERIDGPGRERGVVFQQPALYPWYTVYKNAEFGPMIRKVDKSARRAAVDRYLQMVGLWEFKDSYPYQLSGGMQQRLAIVRALVNEPQVLLADEPFGALDAFTREQMQEELLAVWQATKMTVMFVTHSVEEAVYLGTHVVVMSGRPGRVLNLVEPPFSREADRTAGRAVRASPEFIETREQVLAQILDARREE